MFLFVLRVMELWIAKCVKRGKLSFMRDCDCEPGQECVCAEMEQMLAEVSTSRVIDQGFMVGHENFEVGPGVAVQSGEELVDIYFWTNESDPLQRVGKQPALTIGFDKKATAKLIFTLLQAAKQHGWVENNEEG